MADKESISNLYLSVGICLGIILGLFLNKMAVGISFGLLLGIIIDELSLDKSDTNK